MPATVLDTTRTPSIVLANGGVIAGFEDPNLKPGTRRLVLAHIVADCGAQSATVVRKLPVTLEIVDAVTAKTMTVLQAVPQQ